MSVLSKLSPVLCLSALLCGCTPVPRDEYGRSLKERMHDDLTTQTERNRILDRIAPFYVEADGGKDHRGARDWAALRAYSNIIHAIQDGKKAMR